MTSAVDRTGERLRGVGEQQISAMSSDRISRAFLLRGKARLVALDFNARLVTWLREERIWPRRPLGPYS